MKIKDYKCKNCGSYDFFIKESGSQVGIYCAECGKYLKWADKNERNLAEINAKSSERYGGVKWVKISSSGDYRCSKCRNPAPSLANGKTWFSNFCPYCGERMEL